jgi:SWI/SNF-related matrix-associated actin-dependent regulator 1 of chromatin subfamily A
MSRLTENWGREFERFAPSINVRTYYGTQNDRIYQRAELLKTASEGERDWDVIITTYNLAQGTEHDRKFFKKIDWEVIRRF